MGIFGRYPEPQLFTGDIAIFINTSVENSKRVVKSLNEFGFAESILLLVSTPFRGILPGRTKRKEN
ncbi:MAG: hypothetical protein GXP33_08065 [Spirochaetes bacterium]|nr:hypothetical protein [Spirochaetota bacterium]